MGVTQQARRSAGVAAGVATILMAAACGSGGGAATGGDRPATSAGPVTVEWWGWAPGYDKVAEAWNASHPGIQVKYTQIEPGAKGGYQKMLGG